MFGRFGGELFSGSLIGLTAELDASGNIRIKDSETNQPRYIIPAPYMYDANGILSYDVSYELNRISECTYTLKVVADTEWIHATDRAFPVTIDPTISLDEVVFDSYTYLSSPDENFGFSEQLWVSIYRTAYIFMDLPGLPDGATLNSANLYVYFYYYVTEGSLLAGAYQVLESWEESEITYNNAPAIGTTRLSTATLTASESITESTPGRACFSITSAARDWYEDESTNFGIAIKRESSTTATGTSVVLKAFEAHDYYAYISVNYTYYVPDGVYALKNAYSSNRWMTVEDDSPWQGNHIQQVHSASSPADASVFDRSSLFKISRVPGTSRYIIRSMVNNSISFGISGTEIITKDIPSADSDVAYADTFFIEWDGYGFLIRPYGSSYVINMSSTSTSNLTTIAKSSATSKARWRLVQYTGASRYGSAVYRTTDMNAGTTAIFTPVVWSTKTDWNTAEMTVAPGYYNYATSTWNESTRQGFFALHDNGIFYAFLHIYNGDKTSSYTSTYTFTVTLVVDEGVYFIKNKDVGKYMQIDNNKAPSYTQSGAIMELRSFDGGDYQKWNLTHVVDGYYKIVSVKSGLSLSVQSSHLNDDEYALVQEAYASLSRQLWKITESSSGAYVIRPKSGESYDTDWCMAAEDGIGILNGRNVEQREYTNNTDYKDQWLFEKIKSRAIIIIPGITCSSLQNASGTKVWMYVGRQEQIACDENSNSVNDIYPYNPDNYGILDMYKSIFNTLTTEYSETYDVIFFAYDWRMTCADAAADLEALANYYDSCILVAHSMGGLVASSYLARSSANRAKTDKLITVGTPFTGSPKALYVMETGRLNWISEAALNLSEYAPNIPALYELFPTDEYFDKYTRFIEVDGVAKTGYTEAWDYMKTLDWAKKSSGTVKPMFAKAEAFHNTLFINGTHVTDSPDVDTYKIIGIEEDTITCVAFDADNEYDFYYYSSEGDGTVPAYSALNNADKYSYKTYAYYKNHTDLIKYEGCIQLIIDIINEESYVYYDPSTTASFPTVSTMAEGLITSDAVPQDSDRITIVAKNINNLQIRNGDGHIVYAVGEELYYDNTSGERQRAGSIWALGNNSYQYVLYNNEYTITRIDVLGSDSSIRIDYCNYGLSDHAVLFDGISIADSIQINKLTSQINVATGVSIYRTSDEVTE